MKIFRDEADFLRFEREVHTVTELGGCRCLAACVLNMHYHLLVDVDDGVLRRVMAQINGR